MSYLESLLNWLRAGASKARRAGSLLTVTERVLTGTLIGWTACSVVLAALIQRDTAGWLTAAVVAVVTMLLLPPVLADAVIARENLERAGAAMVRTNTAKPTGAPRVAEVACIHGTGHRFVYGPTGWEPAGPAVSHRHRQATEGVPAS